MLKRTNEEGRQSLWEFSRPEINWLLVGSSAKEKWVFTPVDEPSSIYFRKSFIFLLFVELLKQENLFTKGAV